MRLDPGMRIGPYEIVGALGAGGMGEVYRARDVRLGREVALKVLPEEVASDPARRARFEEEARVIAALNDPNVVAVYDVGAGYIVTELVEGEPVHAGMSVRKVVEVAAQIASGLAAAHAVGIVHRDLKPDNVFLNRQTRVKILDFGLARMPSPQTAAGDITVTVRTEPGVVMGTVRYMSPEQVRGEEIDPRSDIFSFGVLLFELLAGRRPFSGETTVDAMRAILREDAPQLPASVPPVLRDIVARCLEKKPSERFQSAKDLQFALLHSLGASESAPVLPQRRYGGKQRAIAAAALVILCVFIAIAAARIFSRPSTPQWRGEMLQGPESAYFPRLSPDGQMVAFTVLQNRRSYVAVMKLGSGSWTLLTREKSIGQINYLCWSADGTKLYFDRSNDTPVGIYSVPALGGEERLVLENVGYPEALSDGSLLAQRVLPSGARHLVHYRPGSGEIREYPLEISLIAPVRAVPGTLQAVVGARKDKEATPHYYLLDIESGATQRLLDDAVDETQIRMFGARRDDRSLLVSIVDGDLTKIYSMLPQRNHLGSPVLYFPGRTNGIEPGPEGSLLVGQFERVATILRFSTQGGKPQVMARVQSDWVWSLRDGKVVTVGAFAGKSQLKLLNPGQSPVPLLEGGEESAPPVAEVGPGQLAFLAGSPPTRTIAVADTGTGRVIRRQAFEHGAIESLAAAPDGRFLYAVAEGAVWAIPSDGGTAKRLRTGNSVASREDGNSLFITFADLQGLHLLEYFLDGRPERQIPLDRRLRMTPNGLTSTTSAVSHGRVVLPLTSPASWFYLPGIIDTASGQASIIPVDFDGDFLALGWTLDGQIMAWGSAPYGAIWRFMPEPK